MKKSLHFWFGHRVLFLQVPPSSLNSLFRPPLFVLGTPPCFLNLWGKQFVLFRTCIWSLLYMWNEHLRPTVRLIVLHCVELLVPILIHCRFEIF